MLHLPSSIIRVSNIETLHTLVLVLCICSDGIRPQRPVWAKKVGASTSKNLKRLSLGQLMSILLFDHRNLARIGMIHSLRVQRTQKWTM